MERCYTLTYRATGFWCIVSIFCKHWSDSHRVFDVGFGTEHLQLLQLQLQAITSQLHEKIWIYISHHSGISFAHVHTATAGAISNWKMLVTLQALYEYLNITMKSGEMYQIEPFYFL